MLKFRQWWVNHLVYFQSFATIVYFLSMFLLGVSMYGYLVGSVSLFPVLITGCIALAALCFDAYICLVQSDELLKRKK